MSKIAYKSNRNVYFSCKYHVVWCPKYRRKVLVEAVAERLAQIIREVCQEHAKLKTRMPTLWTNSYFVSTVGGVPLSVMKQYIENQKHV